VTNFRDHTVKKALDETIGPWRPEASRRARLVRIATIAALAVAAVATFVFVVDLSAPRPKPPTGDRKPIVVDILPSSRR
jgi:hypothetical protein